MSKPRHEITHFPSARLGTIDLGRIGGRKHHVAVLLQVDVTAALRRLRALRAERREISFFAWLVKQIGDVIAESRYIHAVRGRGRNLILFTDVDLAVMVERTVHGKRVPLVRVIRKTNEKSAEQICAEIHHAQQQELRDEGDYILGETKLSRIALRLYFGLPQAIRLWLLRRLLKNPFRSQSLMGTAIVTTVGAAGRRPGWFIPKVMHNLCFAAGSPAKLPWVVGKRIEIRDILHLTVLFDHDAVDGMPAARFITKLVSRLQHE
jgi:pyruvate/2-oxoglutarate dehydrogenase complex dihydrolipoamide acyltransferase (E2) component